MKFEIEIPEEVLQPVQKVCDGFNIPMERALSIIAQDWIARLDAEFQLFGKPVTPGYRSFDWQFTDCATGYVETYEYSKGIHLPFFADHSEVFQQLGDLLQTEDVKIKEFNGETS